MIENSYVAIVIIIFWILLPLIWALDKSNIIPKIPHWWRSKDRENIVVPSLTIFLLPFVIISATESINGLFFTSCYQNTPKILENVIKLIPVTTFGTYFLGELQKRREIQTVKDRLSIELQRNWYAVEQILLALSITNSQINAYSTIPINDFKALWSCDSYSQDLALISDIEYNLYFSQNKNDDTLYEVLDRIYKGASLIIITNESNQKSYYSMSQNKEFCQRLTFISNDIYKALNLLNNNSKLGFVSINQIKNSRNNKTISDY